MPDNVLSLQNTEKYLKIFTLGNEENLDQCNVNYNNNSVTFLVKGIKSVHFYGFPQCNVLKSNLMTFLFGMCYSEHLTVQISYQN